jgi:hypothetical protein
MLLALIDEGTVPTKYGFVLISRSSATTSILSSTGCALGVIGESPKDFWSPWRLERSEFTGKGWARAEGVARKGYNPGIQPFDSAILIACGHTP